MSKKVMLGMSGGVDSAVAALLLLKEGYDVTGVTMKLQPASPGCSGSPGSCCSIDDVDDARRVAYKLGIDHLTLNFTEAFDEHVIQYFVEEYVRGRTPNPCIACNQKIKFEALLKKALFLGCDYVATGHYARIEYDKQRWLLKKAKSEKDQSYVLYGMTQHQLAHTLMPIANMQKTEVRLLAKKYGLPVAAKPDSQEICFVPNNNYAKFIEEYTGQSSLPGNFLDKHGKIIGQHAGLTKYTVGQRKGLGVSFGEPRYVTSINWKENTITLGREEDLYTESLRACDLNFIPFPKLKDRMYAYTKIRYQAKPAKSLLIPKAENQLEVHFLNPQRAVTPGQAVVFYDEDLVLGGGVIV